MKKVLSLMMVLLLAIGIVGCTPKTEAPEDKPAVETPETEKEKDEAEEPAKENGTIILSTTTSTEDSGLLAFLLPKFTEETGIEVKTVAVGTGKALQMGRDGEADVLLVHAKDSELELVAEGAGTERLDVMYNDFVLVGPKDDPIGLKTNSPEDIKMALKAINDGKADFVSRGDDSGTHKKELKIWEAAEVTPSGEWYIEAGAGMGDVLTMADEKQAYTITDRATYLSMKDDLDLMIVTEGDENLLNQYGVIPVNPDVLEGKSGEINHEGAKSFMNWLVSAEGQALIKEFGVEEYGEPLFIPNAQ
nr:substrate-binding domain-containing protein [Tissierella sp.]